MSIFFFFKYLSCVKNKPFQNLHKRKKKKFESNYCNHFEIYINLMYVQFHTHLWTDEDSITLSCHIKRKKHGLLSTYDLHNKIKIIWLQMFEFIPETLARISVA